MVSQAQGRAIGSPVSTISKNKIPEASPSKGIKKDLKDNRITPKTNTTTRPMNVSDRIDNYRKQFKGGMNQSRNAQKDTVKASPNQQVPTPSSRTSTVKKETTTNIKSPTNKINESQSKFKFKPEEVAQGLVDPENLTLSFLLDQNVSMDSVNLQMPTSSTTVKELENELKKRDISSLTNNSKIEGKKQLNNVSAMNKTLNDTSKTKSKITINSSPIPVKKKNQNQTENK